jgi:hypothetical protein
MSKINEDVFMKEIDPT